MDRILLIQTNMSAVVAEAALRRVAKEARRERLFSIAPDDATHDSREHTAHKLTGPGTGVLAALAQVGMQLTQAQRAAITRLSRRHPELLRHPFTPNTAVENLITLGVPFSDAQLELVSDECTVSGFRRIQSAFEMPRATASHPAIRRATTATNPAVRARTTTSSNTVVPAPRTPPRTAPHPALRRRTISKLEPVEAFESGFFGWLKGLFD